MRVCLGTCETRTASSHSTYMRQLTLSSRLTYSRALPLSRLMGALADRAQLNTMQYGKRPYGVGFLVIGVDATGPHLYEFNPTGNCFEYYAMSLGARNQSAKTYLERHMEEFADADRDALIVHGLRALRETVPQNKEVRRRLLVPYLHAARARRRVYGYCRPGRGRRSKFARSAHRRKVYHDRGRGPCAVVRSVRVCTKTDMPQARTE